MFQGFFLFLYSIRNAEIRNPPGKLLKENRGKSPDNFKKCEDIAGNPDLCYNIARFTSQGRFSKEIDMGPVSSNDALTGKT